MDNSHFVFVIKGLSSEYPLPAGLYRYDATKQLVSVEISENDSEDDFRHYIGLYKQLNLNPLKLIVGKNKYLAKNLGGTYIYNFAGGNLLPFEVKKVYLEKKLDVIRYEDINGKIQSQSIVLLENNPREYLINPFYAVFSILLGLLLCSLFYYFLILKGFLKKLPFPRLHRPQAPDQKHSPRS